MLQTQDFQKSSEGVEINLVDPNKFTVHVKDLVKSYDNGPPILKNLNMTVNPGTIYGLLGSSGCGKTTILSCMVGLQTWNSGELFVFGKCPGKELAIKLGYMPQNLSLYDQLSTFEILQFYRKLYKLSEPELKERWTFLKSLLQLPSKSKLVKDMSGGEQRRASLALALIHSPELLILDEPTVGLDPLLREKIWEYLYTIVKTQNVTIILTTHYIEEARLCDLIGVMRNGKLIVEDAPTNLLERYNCELLEEAVTKLCRDDEEELKLILSSDDNEIALNKIHKHMIKELKDNASNVQRSYRTNENNQPQPTTTVGIFTRAKYMDFQHSFDKIYGLAVVITLTFIRNPVFLALLMIMPTIQCSFTMATIGYRVKHMHFGVVNYDLVNWKSECELQKSKQTSCDLISISCGFVNSIQEDDLLILDSYENEQAAIKDAQLGNIWGYFVIPANYSTHLIDFAAERIFASNETLEGSRIRLRLDHSQYLTALFITKHLCNAYIDVVGQLAKTCGMSKEAVQIPLHFRPALYGDYTDNYANFLIPGVLVWSLGGLPIFLSALIFVSDYKYGTLHRARVAGLNVFDILLSHVLIQSVIVLVQIGVVTGFMYLLFDITIKGLQTQLIYLLINFLSGLVSIPFGLLLGIICREEIEVFVVCMFLVPFYMLWGGVILPTETTTWFWQQLGYIIPLKLPISALRSALIRGLNITHILVWPGIAAFGIWTLIFAVASIVAFKALRL